MKKYYKPVLAAAVYSTIMGIGWALNPHEYGKIKNVIFMIPVLVALTILSLTLLKKSSIPFKTKKTNYPSIFWLFLGLIFYYIVINILAYSNGKSLGSVSDLSLLLVATLFVGVAEEGMYRGYILNTIEKKSGTKKALLYSSLLFGLLHSVNFLAGQKLLTTVTQIFITAAIGYAFAVLYLKSGRNLLLVMLLHGVYDFLVFAFDHLIILNNAEKPLLWARLLSILILATIWRVSVKSGKSLADHNN